MDDSAIYLIVFLVVSIIASALFAANRNSANQTSGRPANRDASRRWVLEKRVNEMTDEPIIWLSLMLESGTEIFQVDRENGKWGLNFTTASALRDGNLVFRFDDGPPHEVSWKQLAAGRRSVLSDVDVAPLIMKLRSATKLRVQYIKLGDALAVARFDVHGFELAAANLPRRTDMKQACTIVVALLLSVASVGAQNLRAVSGGTRTEPDPKDKKLLRLVAETESTRITLGRAIVKHKTARMIPIYVKIENLTDKPLTLKTSTFSIVDDEGKGYYGLETQEAIKRFTDTHGIATAVIAGPLMGPSIQAKMGEEIRRESLESGDIPPRSFKEGIVWFDAPKRQHYTLKVTLGELWREPFVFSTKKD